MITATRKENYADCKNPGDYFIIFGEVGKPARLSFLCPCGCGLLAGIRVHDHSGEAGVWAWNKDLDKPTATPSINIMDGPDKSHWHGYLTDGVFKSC